jgi:hypothetical protein
MVDKFLEAALCVIGRYDEDWTNLPNDWLMLVMSFREDSQFPVSPPGEIVEFAAAVPCLN